MISSACNTIFDKCIQDYHLKDDIETIISNPYPEGSISYLIYFKSWIDNVQWHLEDLIRNPGIDPNEALTLKRKIDAFNKERTERVEFIDKYFLDEYRLIRPKTSATINTESPAWAIDRLSILALKIYHMKIEAARDDAGELHNELCNERLAILLEQRKDLSKAIDELLRDIAQGHKYMKVYKQMKMYNDPSLNPVLYRKNS